MANSDNPFDAIPLPGQKGAATSGAGASDNPFATVPVASASDQRVNKIHDIAMALFHANNPTGAGAVGDLYSQGYTYGLTKPVDAWGNAIGDEIKGMFGHGEVPDATFGERLTAYNKAYDDKIAEQRRNAGGYGTAAEIAGTLTNP